MLNEAKQRPDKAALLKLLHRFLTRPDDRALFNLRPLLPERPDNGTGGRVHGHSGRVLAASGFDERRRQPRPTKRCFPPEAKRNFADGETLMNVILLA